MACVLGYIKFSLLIYLIIKLSCLTLFPHKVQTSKPVLSLKLSLFLFSQAHSLKLKLTNLFQKLNENYQIQGWALSLITLLCPSKTKFGLKTVIYLLFSILQALHYMNFYKIMYVVI